MCYTFPKENPRAYFALVFKNFLFCALMSLVVLGGLCLLVYFTDSGSGSGVDERSTSLEKCLCRIKSFLEPNKNFVYFAKTTKFCFSVIYRTILKFDEFRKIFY